MSDEHSPHFDAVPPLTWMAGLAALADLLLNRVLTPLATELWAGGSLARLDSAGSFARNLSVVSALVALCFCVGSLSSQRSGLPFSSRAGIASFGWVLVPIATMMTFLPRGLTRLELVFTMMALAHALILLLVLAGLHWRSTPALAVGLVLTLVAAFSGILSMMVTRFGGRAYWEHTERLSNAFRWSGELAYLAAPLAIGLAISIPWREWRGKLALVMAGSAAVLVTTAMALWKHAVGSELPDFLYGAMRLDFLPEGYFILYAIPLGLGLAVSVAGISSKDAVRRQIGAAILLLLSAGYAPRTPSAMIVTVLGVALLARAGIALARRR